MKPNRRQRPPGFDRFESFDHDDLNAKHCYFRFSRPPDVDGIRLCDKDNQAVKHCSIYLNVLWPGYLYLKF